MKQRLWNVLFFASAFLAVLAAAAVAVFDRQEPEPEPESAVLYQAEENRTMQVTEITVTETSETQTETTASATETAPLNRDLNTATAEELMRVPGIGSELAAAVIAEREACGGFTRRTDLLRVSGIGEARMDAIMAEFEIPGELPPVQTVPAATSAAPEYPQNTTAPAPQGPFEMNSVTREELLAIPGMHEAQADAILDIRERIGGFTNFYELTLVDELSGQYIEYVLADWLYVEDHILDSAAG
ncbi:MAG: helix-hairpin-helix domain-containing protein [Oscillospiraceae bacterium]|nr:helix-hairpin-helix domain-containing protein [Oscillospiraceae bacterium]MBQ8923140.1 helix-hairpin-helix domain-containing protein [Oscillospiraceae bacterium]